MLIQPFALDQLRGRSAVRKGVAQVHPTGESPRGTVKDQKDQQSPGAPGAAILLQPAAQPESRYEEEPQMALVTQKAHELDIAEGEKADGTEAEGQKGHLPTPEESGGQHERQQSREAL